jgi:hypothetical protein
LILSGGRPQEEFGGEEDGDGDADNHQELLARGALGGLNNAHRQFLDGVENAPKYKLGPPPLFPPKKPEPKPVRPGWAES